MIRRIRDKDWTAMLTRPGNYIVSSIRRTVREWYDSFTAIRYLEVSKELSTIGPAIDPFLEFGFLLSLSVAQDYRRSAEADLKAHPGLSLFSVIINVPCATRRAFYTIKYRNTRKMYPQVCKIYIHAISRFSRWEILFLYDFFCAIFIYLCGRLLHIGTYICNLALTLVDLSYEKSVTSGACGTQLCCKLFAILINGNQTVATDKSIYRNVIV